MTPPSSSSFRLFIFFSFRSPYATFREVVSKDAGSQAAGETPSGRPPNLAVD